MLHIASDGAQGHPRAVGQGGVLVLGKLTHPSRRAVKVDVVPFGVLVGILLAPADGYVYRRLNAYRVRRLDLLFNKVELKAGVHRRNLGWVVGVAVVTLRKHRDKVDICLLQRFCKLRFIKFFADLVNIGACMKIKMYAVHLYIPFVLYFVVSERACGDALVSFGLAR